MRFDFDSNNRILRCRFDGPFTDGVLKEYVRAIGPLFVALAFPLGNLTDLTAVTSWEVSPELFHATASQQPTPQLRTVPRVILAASDHIFEMARAFQLEGAITRPNLHVLRTLEDARAIFGVLRFNFEPIRTREDAS